MATVNDLACKGLDKLEEKLPFLQHPSETVTPPALPDHVGTYVGAVEVGVRNAASSQTQPQYLGQDPVRLQSI